MRTYSQNRDKIAEYFNKTGFRAWEALTNETPVSKIRLKVRQSREKMRRKILSILPPNEANTSSGNEKFNLLWLSIDEWLIYSNDKEMSLDDQTNLEDKLFNEISKLNQGAVTNVSDHWVMINLNGNKVYDLLSKSCPYNFNDFKNKKGSVAQTIVNHIDVILHHKEDNNLNLFVRRSFSEDLWLWINDSARFI